MRAHNITLLMACVFTILACAAHAGGAHVVLVALLAVDAISALILSALYAPAKESHS